MPANRADGEPDRDLLSLHDIFADAGMGAISAHLASRGDYIDHRRIGAHNFCE
jgi:hypothetical protein